jgi:hypothetical protein
MTIDITIAKPARQTLPGVSAVHVALTAACFGLLLAPALWNRYPLLQYDTGGYLARWYEGYLVPSRSTAFGLFLHLGEGLHFWPDLLLQTGCAIWVIWLLLRVTGLAARPWHGIAVITWLSLGTALPFLASALLTDIFAGVGVLALYLLIYHRPDLRRGERIGLFFLIAFAAASHSATLAVLVAVLGFAAASVLPWDRRRISMLLPGGGALATGAAMLVATNFAFSGQVAWTPGGFGIAFGRMLQDGIVKRYLDEHCPNPRLKLCPYRGKLPATADEFLWNGGVFNELGRFDGLGEEMRFIVLQSLHEYPLVQFDTALAATAKQLGQFATGYGMHEQIEHTYGIIRRFISKEVPAMQHARQQRGELSFDVINRIHVPIAFGSMLFLLGLFVRAIRSGRFDDLGRLAAVVTVAILANAFACGALSGPHDRYGARMVWLAAFTAAIAVLRAIENVLAERGRRRSARTPFAPAAIMERPHDRRLTTDLSGSIGG